MGGGSFTPKLNYHVSCKGGGGELQKKKKHDMQERPGYTKVIGRPGS